MPLSSKNLQDVVPSVSRVPSESADGSLQAVTQAIARGEGALVLSSALSGFYLDSLRRIAETRAKFDRARDLEHTDDPRDARFACRDEQKILDLTDQAVRGLCDCLGLKSRIYLESIAELTARDNSEAPEELRRQHGRDLLLLSLYRKALLFHFDLPAELLNEGMGNQLQAFVSEEISKQGSRPSGGGELASTFGATSKRRPAHQHNSRLRNDGGKEDTNDEIDR